MKSKRVNVWDFSLKVGSKGEEIVREKLQAFMTKITLKRFDFELYPEIQRKGIDLFLSKDKPTIEIKSRLSFALKYGDVLLELRTHNKPGWFYTSRADYIAYVIFNKQKTDLVKGYLIALQNPKLRTFIENNIEKYEHKIAYSENQGSFWVTDNIAVPISDFPEGTLFQFITPKGKAWGKNQKLSRSICSAGGKK